MEALLRDVPARGEDLAVKTSTNALTKRYCDLVGLPCETVQRFYGGRRHDLFGIADSIALDGPLAVLIQNCSYGTLKAHRDEISKSPMLEAVLYAGLCFELWEWRRKKLKRGGKNKGREWYLRIQRAHVSGSGLWLEPTDWDGPFDLYATKAKA